MALVQAYKRPVIAEFGDRMAVVAYGALWWWMVNQWSNDLGRTSYKKHFLLGPTTGLRDFYVNGPMFHFRYTYCAVVSEEAGEAQPTMQVASRVRKDKREKQPIADTLHVSMAETATKNLTGGSGGRIQWQRPQEFLFLNVYIHQRLFATVRAHNCAC